MHPRGPQEGSKRPPRGPQEFPMIMEALWGPWSPPGAFLRVPSQAVGPSELHCACVVLCC
eukprot:125882-Pyramimonas_sp.AAC.1